MAPTVRKPLKQTFKGMARCHLNLLLNLSNNLGMEDTHGSTLIFADHKFIITTTDTQISLLPKRRYKNKNMSLKRLVSAQKIDIVNKKINNDNIRNKEDFDKKNAKTS